MIRVRRTAALAALGVMALLAAGCASSSSAAGSGNTKSPIKLMVDTTMTPAASFGGLSFPYPAVGAKAAATALNAKGGIDGHPVQIDVCDNQGNPDQSAACGRKAKSNGDIAVIGAWDIYGAAEILPVLQAEGIPVRRVARRAAGGTEQSRLVQFRSGRGPGRVGNGGPVASGGLQERRRVPVSGVAAEQQEVAGQQAIAKADGVKLQTVNITVGQADVTAPVSTAMSLQPDCVTYEGDGQTNAKLDRRAAPDRLHGQDHHRARQPPPAVPGVAGQAGQRRHRAEHDPVPGFDRPGGHRLPQPGHRLHRQREGRSRGPERVRPGRVVQRAARRPGAHRRRQLHLRRTAEEAADDVRRERRQRLPQRRLLQAGRAEHRLPARLQHELALTTWEQNGVYVPLDNEWHNLASTVPTGS